jgi:hypothetical protein
MTLSHIVSALLVFFGATFAQQHPRPHHIARQAELAQIPSTDGTLAGISKEVLTQKWWNWVECTTPTAESNSVVDPQDSLVPADVVFLATSSLTCGTTKTLSGTIPVSTKLVFMPVIQYGWFSIDNDVVDNVNEDCVPGYRNTTLFADSVALNAMQLQNMSRYSIPPFALVKGGALEVFWFYSATPFYAQNCPNGVMLNDTCDIPTMQAWGGQDLYPTLGWWAADTKAWSCGETREYSVGASYNNPEFSSTDCNSLKTTLTATCTQRSAGGRLTPWHGAVTRPTSTILGQIVALLLLLLH